MSKENMHYHIKADDSISCTSNPARPDTEKYKEVNLTWDEIQPYINPPPTPEQLAQTAQSEMIQELNWVDLQLKYHSTGDTKRAISTVELINTYAVDCRDYVQNDNGVLTIVGDKPERPE